MSIVSTQSASSSVQTLAQTVLQQFDLNGDGQLSASEFSQFLTRLIDSLAGGTAAGLSALSASSTPPGSSTPTAAATAPLTSLTSPTSSSPSYAFAGFDASRAQSAAGSLKYDAYAVLQKFNPADPTSMQQAYQQLNQMHPGQYTLDSSGNLMLTGDAAGYIGARPLGYDGTSWNTSGGWQWQWFAYNGAHPGPSGETS
ncbi:MAG TPA: EF-hand domain-containing protein [Vicinamibacterales bacterium]|nr:EF-hand domain-containing protein [Vicinamibacterales bacterium]